MSILSPFLFILLVLFAQQPVNARVPRLINYQGRLDVVANPDSALTGEVGIRFAIYGAAIGGEALWSESHQIRVQNGLFNVLLGGKTPLSEDLFSASDSYLGLTVDSNEEMSPRQRIVSVAYALRAAQAGIADSIGGPITVESLALESGGGSVDASGRIIARQIQVDSISVGEMSGIDAAGVLRAAQVIADSISVGGIGVIDRTGRWVGTGTLSQSSGMMLDTIVVKNLRDSISFASSSFRDIDGTNEGLTAFASLKRTSLLDIRADLTVTVGGGLFQTRLAVQPINPSGPAQTNISNTSSFVPASGTGTSPIGNHAVITLPPGLYRILIEGKIEGASTIQTGILTVRVYSR